MLNFICLGSGSSGNCYYLWTDEGGIMIDAGIGIRGIKKIFREYGLSFRLLNAIFVTHEHADHIKAVGALSDDQNLPVYATAKVHEGMMRNYCMTTKVKTERCKILEKNTSIELVGFSITPFTVPHDSSDNVGYLIKTKGKTFCLITDAGSVTEEMKSYIKQADYLVIEANYDDHMLAMGPYPPYLKVRIASDSGHMCNTCTAQTLIENGFDKLKYVWLCHLSEENNHPELARKTVEAAIQSQGLLVGKDIHLEVLKRKVPSGIYNL